MPDIENNNETSSFITRRNNSKNKGISRSYAIVAIFMIMYVSILATLFIGVLCIRHKKSIIDFIAKIFEFLYKLIMSHFGNSNNNVFPSSTNETTPINE
ncbi:uncharacterized protein VNE69_02132 [Vairimorpha necatrix]|uniref:Membrane protein n=1 Tax=Vairimorpha necatrix TaxID=6039 RepID=A0AAX4J9R9_9MICR